VTTGSQTLDTLRRLLFVLEDGKTDGQAITLLTAGGIVAGNAVSRARWCRELGKQVETTIVATAEVGAHQSIAAALFTRSASHGPAGPDQVTDAYLINAILLPLVLPSNDADLTYGPTACWQVSMQQVIAWTFGPVPD